MIDLDTSAADFLSYLLIVKFRRIESESPGDQSYYSQIAFNKVTKIVKKYFYVWRIANEEAFIFTVFINKLREIDEHVKEIQEVPYVKDIISFIPTKMFYFRSWIDKLIETNASD